MPAPAITQSLRGVDESRGTSLVEVLVATAIFAVGLTATAPLLVSAVRSTRAARELTVATWLAWQKAEELRGLTYVRDEAGLPVTDTDADTAVEPLGRGGTGLQMSPADSLTNEAAGYVDHLDESGRKVRPPAPYVRRWRIRGAGAVEDALQITVRVHHVRHPGTPVSVAVLRARRTP